MDTIRYVDTNWHHYCKRAGIDPTKVFTDFIKYKNTIGKKYSYIQDFGLEDAEQLENKIKLHLEVADHVFVGFGEPLIMYKDKTNGWDHEHNCWDGPWYYTDDFINKFKDTDCISFFANAVSHVRLNRPMYYLNDMFFQDHNIYNDYEVCKTLLTKLTNHTNKKYYWELMCSNNTDLYHLLKGHKVDPLTFSTCHKLGITHWGPDVIAPKDSRSGAESFGKYHNIRCSDLIDPSIYNQSYYSCVVETVIPEDNRISMFSEKQAKPIIAGRPFIIMGTKDHLKAFRSLGFKTFDKVIDESYDDEPDFYKRAIKILDSMNKLCELDPTDVYSRLETVLEHNKNHFYNNNWNNELQKAWLTPSLLVE